MARITGKLAALYLGEPLVRVADLFDVTFEATNENLVASIKGDVFERYSPSHGTARITASRYVNTTALMMKEAYDAVKNGDQLAFRVDLVDANASFSQISGTGYFDSASLAAPRGLIVDGFEIIVDGEWTITQPGAN